MTKQLNEEKLKSIGIERTGERITIPPTVSLEEALVVIDRQRTEEERTVNVNEEVDGYPMDSAYAFAKALKQIYGWTDLTVHTVQGFFGPVEHKPEMHSLQVGVDEMVQVPLGRIEIPGIKGYLLTSFTKKNGDWIFLIAGEVRKKHLLEVKRIADLTRRLVKEESIYKGKAIRLNFSADPRTEEDRLVDPTFIDTRTVREEELIFSDTVEAMVETSLFTPVEHTASCRKHGIPLKRGILLEGVYGTGKTLTAYVTAKKATANGWTFVYLNNVNKLPQALAFARRYQPAVLFAEDVDQAVGTERDEDVNDILNTLDGVEGKGGEVITILTTNNVEKIHQALLRPGRLDAVIHMSPPDAGAVEKLIRLYGRGLVNETEDLRKVSQRLAERQTIPATIREVVERAKLAAIRHLRDDQMRLTARDLEVATEGMLTHLALLAPKQEDNRTETERFAEVLGDKMGTALKEAASHKNGNGSHLGMPPA
jgi:transitional endoplasmic reticulum ATPase